MFLPAVAASKVSAVKLSTSALTTEAVQRATARGTRTNFMVKSNSGTQTMIVAWQQFAGALGGHYDSENDPGSKFGQPWRRKAIPTDRYSSGFSSMSPL